MDVTRTNAAVISAYTKLAATGRPVTSAQLETLAKEELGTTFDRRELQNEIAKLLASPPKQFAQATARSTPLHPSQLNVKGRTEAPAIYPKRFPVPDDGVSWDVPFARYAPKYFVAESVIKAAGAWADPEDFDKVRNQEFKSHHPLRFDDDGYPLNPMGRTGVEGRGLLGRWGANQAADPIITRENPETGQLEMIAIRRKDTGQWAIPGGMVDFGEEITNTLARELEEETGGKLDMAQARMIYQGYVDDPRNTDNAWMETTVKHLHLTGAEAAKLDLVAGDDASAVKWMPLTEANIASLYASHGDFVRKALASI